MDPTRHRVDDELQKKARFAKGSSSRTKARGVRTECTNLVRRRVQRGGDLRKPVVAKSSTNS